MHGLLRNRVASLGVIEAARLLPPILPPRWPRLGPPRGKSSSRDGLEPLLWWRLPLSRRRTSFLRHLIETLSFSASASSLAFRRRSLAFWVWADLLASPQGSHVGLSIQAVLKFKVARCRPVRLCAVLCNIGHRGKGCLKAASGWANNRSTHKCKLLKHNKLSALKIPGLCVRFREIGAARVDFPFFVEA